MAKTTQKMGKNQEKVVKTLKSGPRNGCFCKKPAKNTKYRQK